LRQLPEAMMDGNCSHCRQTGIVWRYRMAGLGLRYLDVDCAARLDALGCHIEPVTNADPRATNRGIEARRIPGVGIRSALRSLVRAAA
jgi:hypothetical protein